MKYTIDNYVSTRLDGEGLEINQVKEAQLLQYGMKGETLKQVANVLPKASLARVLETAPSNLSKMYSRKTLSRSQTEAVFESVKVWQDTIELFSNDQSLAMQWFETAIPAIGGEKPIDLFDSFAGRAVIRTLLEQLKYGDYN